MGQEIYRMILVPLIVSKSKEVLRKKKKLEMMQVYQRNKGGNKELPMTKPRTV